MGYGDRAGWQPDPTGRHQHRYHDGTSFTAHVADNGVASSDPYVASTPTPPPTQGGPPPVTGSAGPAATPWPGYAQPGASPAPYGTPPAQPFGQPAPYGSPPAQPFGQPAPYGSPPAQPFGQPAPYGSPPAQPFGQPGPYGPYPGMASPYGAVPQKRRAGRAWVITGAVVAVAVIVALSVALVATSNNSPSKSTSQPIGSAVPPSGSFSQSMGNVVYSSNFGPNDNWITGPVGGNTTITLSGGKYVVHAGTKVHHPLLMPYGAPHAAMSVEAGATGYPSTNVSIGVGCQSDAGVVPPLVYQLVVYPDGQWYVEEARLPGGVETLVSGTTSPLGASATVQLTCVLTNRNSGETTQLVAYVNGEKVGAIGSQISGSGVSGFIPILVVGSFGPTVTVAYTSVTVRAASGG